VKKARAVFSLSFPKKAIPAVLVGFFFPAPVFSPLTGRRREGGFASAFFFPSSFLTSCCFLPRGSSSFFLVKSIEPVSVRRPLPLPFFPFGENSGLFCGWARCLSFFQPCRVERAIPAILLFSCPPLPCTPLLLAIFWVTPIF